MGEVPDRSAQLATARVEFVANGNSAPCDLPNHVAASWRRSASYGVSPDEVCPDYWTDLDFGSRLVRCAQPVIEQLVDQLSDIPLGVALTDDRARLLSRRDSDSWIGRRLDRVYFAQGFGYAEGTVGTNGVGTVLEFGDSVHIVGAEHFVDSLQSFACAGAPVRNPFTGRVEGVLDVSCLSRHSTPVMHSLVRSAAQRIENNLLLDRNQTQQALFEAYSRTDAHGRQAVLAVGRRTVMANSAIQALLDPADLDAVQDHVRFMMFRRATVDNGIELPSGRRVRLRGSTVQVGTELAGMVSVVSVFREAASSPTTGRALSSQRVVGAPRSRDEESRCPAWREAASTVDIAVRAADPVLVLGEQGSGRLTVLTDVHRLVHAGGQVVVLEASAVDAAPAEAIARLTEPVTEPTLCVLRDVDQLSARTVEALAAAVPESGDGLRTLAATASGTIAEHAAHERLLSMFNASATVPALRHRRVDLPMLARSLLSDLAARRDVRLSDEALRLLGGYSWPGNVRQLKQALSEALARRPVGVVEAHDLPAFCQSTPRSALRPVDETERDMIIAALRESGGNRVATATALGIARSTLYRKIRQYGITA
ncbi:transcriptional regulator MimR [Prauserella halophila]|uniref:Transcriptional regulator MimR n=1 Tax=Prauserella halophila TaxID=185641 RepID=A0ABN1W3Y0_9PSEU|nr:helix-turn-helix domain-containing protein [Prauserella halophila]MCP2238685.1 DNA-binding transcriptional response regulator, NtrC family, contains REC, AAA-type ATPase, and a Fis-type DNA-binding domains [Prauserella halophila]